jgi:hypothetical protein
MTTINATTVVQPLDQGLRRRSLRRLLAFAGGVFAVLIVAAVALYMWMSYVPSDLDYSTTRMSEQMRFKVGYASDLGSVPVNQMQSWTLHVETSDGQPVENATIAVDGDMPQHGHGLPTRPQVTRYLGNGDYRVEGLKFHMPGWWVMDFVVTADGQTDQVHFNMLLK